MRRPAAAVWLIVTLAMIGCGGGARKVAAPRRVATDIDRPRPVATTTTTTTPGARKAPAPFSVQATRVCAGVGPRLKATVQQVTLVNSAAGNPLAKLPKLAALLSQISAEFNALHGGLARLRAPTIHRTAYYAFVHDLYMLRKLTATMAADLRLGTIAGLDRYRPLAARFSARAAVLEAHRKKAALPPNACRNLGT